MTPEELHISILWAAIQGKLTTQDPSEVSSKPISNVPDEEVYFDIPENWHRFLIKDVGDFRFEDLRLQIDPQSGTNDTSGVADATTVGVEQATATHARDATLTTARGAQPPPTGSGIICHRTICRFSASNTNATRMRVSAIFGLP